MLGVKSKPWKVDDSDCPVDIAGVIMLALMKVEMNFHLLREYQSEYLDVQIILSAPASYNNPPDGRLSLILDEVN
jgi:hypothetical protein